MRAAVLAFLLGLLVLHGQSALPSPAWLLGLPTVVVAAWRWPWLRLPGWFALGFAWGLLWAWWQLQNPLPADLEGVDLTVTGWIASIPESGSRRTRFELVPDTLHADGEPIALGGRLRLSWYATPPPRLTVGDRWQLTVRLRRPRGFMNPGGFDFERWLFVNGIRATGYVREQPAPRLLARAERYPIDRLRQRIGQHFEQLLPGDPYRGILTALAIGDRQGISNDQWDLFQRTGTGHLMAISGLHIGLLAGLAFWLIRRLWVLVPGLVLRWPAPQAAALGALLAATGYALLAGLSLPTQRALVMLSVALLALLLRRPAVPSRILAAALLAVLLLDPGAPLAAGFWLSFGAVAALLYALAGRYPRPVELAQWLRLQLVILIALAPITLSLFQTLTPIALLANLIAIPWASFTIVPSTLLAVLLSPFSDTLAGGLLHIAARTLEFLWRILYRLATLPGGQISLAAPPLWALLPALPGVLLLLAPRGLPGRWLGLPLCLPLLVFPIDAPAPGSARFTLLDVGSGLATVVQTRHHVLVYDTGPWLGPRLDGGRSALLPLLRQQGVNRIDTVIVSHADGQHSGGVRSLLDALPATRILTASPMATPIRGAEACVAGDRWRHDGVEFRILHPPAGPNPGTDDHSCVLLVEAGGRRLLLAGDLEAAGLRALLPQLAEHAPVDILLAPHQGRRPLPLPELLELVEPRYVLFATGHGNRWGYPRPETVAGYTATGATLLDTADSGAIYFDLAADTPLEAGRYREQARRYWHMP